MSPAEVGSVAIVWAAAMAVPGSVFLQTRRAQTGHRRWDGSRGRFLIASFAYGLLYTLIVLLVWGSPALALWYTATPLEANWRAIAALSLLLGFVLPWICAKSLNKVDAASRHRSVLQRRGEITPGHIPAGGRFAKLRDLQQQVREYVLSRLQRLGSVHDETAWDRAMRTSGDSIVIIHRPGQEDLVGWYGMDHSFTSTEPELPAVFIEHRMHQDGSGRFVPTKNSEGFWYPIGPGDWVEFCYQTSNVTPKEGG